MQGIFVEPQEIVLSSLRKLRSMLSSKFDTPIQEAIDLGAVPKLIELIGKKENYSIQYEAAWCLTNIASGSEDQVKSIISKGGIPALMGMMNTIHRNNQEQVHIFTI